MPAEEYIKYILIILSLSAGRDRCSLFNFLLLTSTSVFYLDCGSGVDFINSSTAATPARWIQTALQHFKELICLSYKMTTQNILANVGQFSATEIALFEKLTTRKTFNKNDILLKEGEVCQTVFFILSGCFFQFQTDETTETIIDLHLEKEWMFNYQSLIGQARSKTVIKAFAKSEVIELKLYSLHCLIAKSQAFLYLGNIFNQVNSRTYLFDNSLNPAQKYNYIKEVKPLLSQMFPVKMIASYLKIAPETLSRVRAKY